MTITGEEHRKILLNAIVEEMAEQAKTDPEAVIAALDCLCDMMTPEDRDAFMQKARRLTGGT